MSQLLNKLFFAGKITAGLPSFARLLWHSKKLRWSKTGFLKANPAAKPACIQISYPGKKRKLFLRTYDGDIDIFYEIFWKKIYELPQVDPAKIKTIVDIGANIGLSALYFLHMYPHAKFICVEPEPSNFALLSQNLSVEIAGGKVSALCAAVMGKDGHVSFKSEPAKFNSKVLEDGGEKNVKAVSMKSLLELYALDHIDLLKIDVEGAEKYIFVDDTAWLDKIDNIIIELHSPLDYEVCMKALSLHQFSVVPLNVCPGNENLYWARKNLNSRLG